MAYKEVEAVCTACDGTGLYSGMGESDGLAIVCSRCEGSGKHIIRYKPFTKRRKTTKVKRVIQHNPGISLNLEAVGDAGLSYKDWIADKEFVRGSELRKHCCPLWWVQTAGGKKFEWKQCDVGWGKSFSSCVNYGNKAACWEKWDKRAGVR